jgi:AraC-like DNA-binding protein
MQPLTPWTDPSVGLEARARAWAEALDPVFEVKVTDADQMATPRELQNYALGTMILGRADAPGQRRVRDSRRCATHGVDHVLIQHYLTGHGRIEARGRSRAIHAGDFTVTDLSQPIRVDAEEVRALNLVVPRALLGDGEVGDLHGSVLTPGLTPFAAALSSFLREADALAPSLSAAQGHQLTEVAAGLLQLALGAPVDDNRPRDPLGLKPAVRRFILDRLGDPKLDTQMVLSRFGVSRSALYRLFDEDGGVHAYVRDLRLARAWRLLTAPGPARTRVASVAFACGFRDESAFSRAFRRRFGLSPSEAGVGAPPPSGSDADSLAAWLRELAP